MEIKKISFLKHIMFAALIIFVVDNSARADTSPPMPPPIADKGYHLVKNWDFGSTITTLETMRHEFYTRYTGDHGTVDHLHGEWERYRDNDNHEISNGALHLIARDPSGVLEEGAIESGMILSKWRSRYGYFEARMKVPKGRGMWPAFWFSTEAWPPEIDAVEVVNNGNSTTASSFHALHGKYIGKTLSSRLDKYENYRPGFDYSDDFHTFAVEWTPTSVKHYVDNVLVIEREFEWRHNDSMLAEPPPVVINLAVGGSWPGAPTDLKEFPASLDIAYIRVWQR